MLFRHMLFHIALLLMIVPLAATAQQATPAGPAAPAAAAAPLDVNTIATLALAVHPSARAAQQRLLEAQAKYGESVAQFRLQPTFTASSSGSYGRVAYPNSEQGF